MDRKRNDRIRGTIGATELSKKFMSRGYSGEDYIGRRIIEMRVEETGARDRRR